MVDMTQFLEGTHPKFELMMNNPKMDRMVPYIQAFEIEITQWEGKFKLSQDKIAKDYDLAKEELIKNSKSNDKDFIEKIYSED